ncbi:TAXI family TRAP transporter solute-binding subunit [Paracoccus sp. 1_MG-2023]|uniref:TAXI family TRAP transporter solute-binding subunit n=1 Tax=unclassified Paracoccus (in: a-proteobacteria) TaxID=2688777 RepID=UPI001C08F8CB|nr:MULTISPECIES: TAXI family TRAP transporter solute-binding subunit [unclassified Paracoccus (in: a-proteobacteria)]MBU2958489.1 TAXI family TRAP transporter solute-binding subunit [Paracoccus sp. C2R09]MDO6668526.1 TAXI family TRAP transporter solute-binding subunit [Paracoccus sp. 1_MG-2023]
MRRWKHAMLAGAVLVTAGAAHAETRLTYKSAKTGTSYYQMAVELAEGVRGATEGELAVTVEESQGSVQNVMEVRARGGDYVFTAPPSLVSAAQAGSGPFEGKGNPRFDEIRALFPIPSLTMHFVVGGSEGPTDLSALEGQRILLGKGSFGASEGQKYLDLFGLTDKVTIADAELSNAGDALTNGQIDGFVTAGSFPAPNVIEAAAGEGVRILSMTDEQVAQTGQARVVIPADVYPGQAGDIVTTGLPVVAFASTEMDDETAYQLTRAFWTQRDAMAETAPWWSGVGTDQVAELGALHPGAARYYEEAGVAVGE